jgi:hypothetical protein
LSGISSAEATAIATADIAHALQNPAPTAPFKQPGTERMQAIKNGTTEGSNSKGGCDETTYIASSKGTGSKAHEPPQQHPLSPEYLDGATSLCK